MNNGGKAAACCRTVFSRKLLCSYFIWLHFCSFNEITLFSPFYASWVLWTLAFPVKDHNLMGFFGLFVFPKFYIKNNLNFSDFSRFNGCRSASFLGASGAAARLWRSDSRISIKLANHSMRSDDQICQNPGGAALSSSSFKCILNAFCSELIHFNRCLFLLS